MRASILHSRYYQPIRCCLLRGYGAGNAVTAAGIFADILKNITPLKKDSNMFKNLCSRIECKY